MTRRPPEQIVGHALGLGALFGSLVGAVVGTLIFPIVATIIGAVVGAFVGAAVGLLSGFILSATAVYTSRRWPLRLAGGLTSLGCGAAMVALSGLSLNSRTMTDVAVFVTVCAALGASLAIVVVEEPAARCPVGSGAIRS